jgi:hypothetical protein
MARVRQAVRFRKHNLQILGNSNVPLMARVSFHLRSIHMLDLLLRTVVIYMTDHLLTAVQCVQSNLGIIGHEVAQII